MPSLLRMVCLAFLLFELVTIPAQAQSTPDPRQAEQWHLERVGAPTLWANSVGGATLVGVVDTGIDYTHPDLASHIWQNLAEDADGDGRTLEFLDGRWQLDPGDLNGIDDDDFDGDPNTFIDDLIGWDFVDHDNDPMDTAGHGTHIAGLIGAEAGNGVGGAGVAQSVRMMALRVARSTKNVDLRAAIQASDYARALGARIVNHSWGSRAKHAILGEAAERAHSSGVLWVCATGFSAVPGTNAPFYPAAFPFDNIVSVASSSRADARMTLSNYDPAWVDLAAPAEDLLSTSLWETYAESSGTSMAAAVVTGAAAQLLAHVPDLAYWEVREALMAGARPVDAMAGHVASGGVLDAPEALAYARVGIRTSAEAFVFEDAYLGQTYSSQRRIVTNRTGAPLQLTLAAAHPMFTVVPTRLDIAAQDTASYVVRFTPDASGTQHGELVLQSNGWSRTIALEGDVLMPARATITVHLTNTTFRPGSYVIGGGLVQVGSVRLSNEGDTPLSWQLSSQPRANRGLYLSDESGRLQGRASRSIALSVEPGLWQQGTFKTNLVLETNTVLEPQIEFPLSFTMSRPELPALRNGDFAWGDYDGDGDQDAVMTGYYGVTGQPRAILLQNRGDGYMQEMPTSTLPQQVAEVAWGGLTPQGKRYLAMARADAVQLFTVESGGQVRFVEEYPSIGQDVLWTDYDGDGDLDLLGTNAMLIAEGTLRERTFVHRLLALPVSILHGAWYDNDDDGVLDLLGTNAEGVWLFTQLEDTLHTEALALGAYAKALPAWSYMAATPSLKPNPMVFEDSQARHWVQQDEEWSEHCHILHVSGPVRDAQWADVDGDGSMEAAVITDGRLAIYQYSHLGFEVMHTLQVPQGAALAFGHLDGENYLDLAVTGGWSDINWHMPFYTWQASRRNAVPAMPTRLQGSVTADQVSLYWQPGEQSALPDIVQWRQTYDLWLIDAQGAPIILPEANLANGKRAVAQPGKLGTVPTWTGKLLPGTYLWTVQTVDGSFTGSRFPPFETLVVPLDPDEADDVNAGDDGDDGDQVDDVDRPDPEETPTPVRFVLDAIYPNPTHNTAQVVYTLPTVSFVRLTVTDMLGRTVAVLFDGSQVEGEHTVTWDAADAAPGVYLVRMETPTWQASRTVLRVR